MLRLRNPLTTVYAVLFTAPQRRIRDWFHQRLPARDNMVLTQRNVYIIPTRAGWMLALTVLVLLVASINYQLNLGYALTFLLAGSVAISMHVCHATLRGLAMHLIAPPALFMGSAGKIRIEVQNPSKRTRWALALGLLDSTEPIWLHVDAHSQTGLDVPFVPHARGWQPLPRLSAHTRFPLGAFHAWTVWKPAARVLVYPQPEPHAPTLPLTAARTEQHSTEDELPTTTAQPHPVTKGDGSLPEDVRPYRRGDPLKWVVWKKAARTDRIDQWVSRTHGPDSPPSRERTVWLDWQQAQQSLHTLPHQHTAPAMDLYPNAHEHALGRLCAWVLQAQEQGLHYGLRLPNVHIAPDNGPDHQSACLQALALA
ncbi:DUF58 domain-containing protein [Curvibacter sp. CHRR-16]|uniref:DUF58 domain-containing protein n=1 Tax=Curvibacter sp. CHRR-16 TaxID=2835872 RepID=UPI001BDB181B|nr:DUF58 domain-containing protein [Curvibacter sp. CHRR-16]MBT0568904.1 DUF58 domain-containing protein [Curvibacter sp. CHRR-16]